MRFKSIIMVSETKSMELMMTLNQQCLAHNILPKHSKKDSKQFERGVGKILLARLINH